MITSGVLGVILFNLSPNKMQAHIITAKKFTDKMSVKTGKIFFPDLDFSFGIAYPLLKKIPYYS